MAGAGYTFVYLGWGVGVAVLGVLALGVGRGDRDRDRHGSGTRSGPLVAAIGRVLLIGGSALALASLTLPWLDGFERGTGAPLALRGWEGLDPFSVGFVVIALVVVIVGCSVGAGRRLDTTLLDGPTIAVLLVGCAGLVVVGNLLVQLAEPGPVVAPGFVLGSAVVLVSLVGALIVRLTNGGTR